MARKPNPFGKTKKDGHFHFYDGMFDYTVRKLYKSPESSLDDAYSRAFCLVRSPMTGPSGDLGDVYVHQIPGLVSALRRWVKDNQREEVLKGAP